MSSIRRHSCVALTPPPAPSMKRPIKLPRRVIASGAKFQDTSKRTTNAYHAFKRCNGTVTDGAVYFTHEAETCANIAVRNSSRLLVDNDETIRKTLSKSELKFDKKLPENIVSNLMTTKSSNVLYCDGMESMDLEQPVEEHFWNKRYCPVDSVGKNEISESRTKVAPGSRVPHADGIRSCHYNKLINNTKLQSKQSLRDDISDITEFRDRYFFQCHSAEAMLRQKPSVLREPGHRCSYRFYLNERLFPVPLHSDHENTVRCSDCHLSVDLNPSIEAHTRDTNGTIQAKVKIGADKVPKDVILLLPVDSTLVTEKRKRADDVADEEIMHFGILKIDNRRSAVMKRFAPQDSFALRYQKGYREYRSGEFRYAGHKEDDVIIL